jgi:hypothetical protein
MPIPSGATVQSLTNTNFVVSLAVLDVHGEPDTITVSFPAGPLTNIDPSNDGVSAPSFQTIDDAVTSLALVLGAATNAAVTGVSWGKYKSLIPSERVAASSGEYATTSNVANFSMRADNGLGPIRVGFSVPAPLQAIFGPLGTENAATITTAGNPGPAAAKTVTDAVNAFLSAMGQGTPAFTERVTIGSRKGKFGRRRNPIIVPA